MSTIDYSGAPNPVYQGLFADFTRAIDYVGLDIARPVPIDGLSGTYPLAVRSVYDRSSYHLLQLMEYIYHNSLDMLGPVQNIQILSIAVKLLL